MATKMTKSTHKALIAQFFNNVAHGLGEAELYKTNSFFFKIQFQLLISCEINFFACSEDIYPNVAALKGLFSPSWTEKYTKKEQISFNTKRGLYKGHPTIERMQKLAKELSVVVTVSFLEEVNNAHYNSNAIIDTVGTDVGLIGSPIILMDHVSQVWSWKEFDLLLLILFLNFRLSREVYFNPGYPSFKVYVEINGFPRQQALWFYRILYQICQRQIKIKQFPRRIASEAYRAMMIWKDDQDEMSLNVNTANNVDLGGSIDFISESGWMGMLTCLDDVTHFLQHRRGIETG
ncbi:hypothetical protein IGI04_002896 [Brassica rapa subsp. trilocularis]|uniref:Uncharacterized protein n=1 Tax=Brassica rapa subsp. trilocularis TaxID=1813537 RepID=A0ABQ7NWW4_BRACM|nr:hypothetical protein IGI04_002896 [Brassica rapa subsp. trilocularis]